MEIAYYQRIGSFFFNAKRQGIKHICFALCLVSLLQRDGQWLLFCFYLLGLSLLHFAKRYLPLSDYRFYLLLFVLLFLFNGYLRGSLKRSETARTEYGQTLTMTLIKKKILSYGEKRNLVLYHNHRGCRYAVWLNSEQPVPKLISGRFQIDAPQAARNPGGFRQTDYLASYHCFALAEPLTVDTKIDFVARLAFRKKQFLAHFHDWLGRVTEQNSADFILSFCFGQRQYLNTHLQQTFQGLGLQHVLAVSGFHFELFLLPLLAVKPRAARKALGYRLFLCFAGFSFLWLTDYPIGLCRAFWQFVLNDFFLAKGIFISRKNLLLLLTGFWLLVDPFCIWQLGFQMSFGICYLLYLLMPYLQRIPLLRQTKVLYSLALGLAVQILITPYLIGHFKITALASFLYTTLLTPGFIVIFSGGFIFLLLYILPFSIEIGSILLFAGHSVSVFLSGLSMLSQSSFNHLLLTRQTQLSSIFLLLSLLFFLLRSFWHTMQYIRFRQTARRKLSIAVLLLAFLLFIFFRTLFPAGHWRIFFFDVGQGDCCLLVSPQNKTLLIDGGKTGKGYDVILPAMRQLGIDKIDYALISHLDEDHCGGIIDLLQNNLVDHLYLPIRTFVMQKSSTDLQKEILYQHLKNKFTMQELQAGEKVEFSLTGLQMQILSPAPTDYSEEDTNNMSLCFILSVEGLSLFFTGDIDAEQEKKILARYDLPEVDVLKVAHHGSKYASSAFFLKELNPRLAVISVGYNRYGHPHQNVLERLQKKAIQIKRTDLHGAIMLELKENIWQIATCIK